MPSPVSSHLAAHSSQAQTTNAEGAPCWLDLGLCDRLGSLTAHSGQAQTTNAKRAPLLAGLRFLLQPGLPNCFKSKLQEGRRSLYQKLSVTVTDYIISVHACKSYTINAVSGFTKKCLLVVYHNLQVKVENRMYLDRLKEIAHCITTTVYQNITNCSAHM